MTTTESGDIGQSSSDSAPGDSSAQYVLAHPTNTSTVHTLSGGVHVLPSDTEDQEPTSAASSHSSGTSSFNTDSLLEVLDDDEDVMDEDLIFDEEADGDVGQPLVPRSGRRRRRRWDDSEENAEKNIFQLIPSLILAHPLALFPLLAVLPYNFLPAGVVLFVPIICVLAILSACAHIVIVYLSWYLKVSSFEDVFAAVTGRFGVYGLWTGRVAIVSSVVGMLTGWLHTLYPLLQPLLETYGSRSSLFSSRPLWTLVASTTLLPSLLPSRMTRSLRNAPWVFSLILPIIAFLVIGRTVEISKAEQLLPIEGGSDNIISSESPHRRSSLASSSSAIAGLTILAVFFTPHVNTLPIHSSLARAKRGSFPLPCLIASTLLLTLSLPLALVPYYLLSLPDDTSVDSNSSGVFAQLPLDDGWVNFARLLMCSLSLGSCNMWLLRGRDVILKSMGVDHGERMKAGKWVGLALWTVVVSFACTGGWVAAKIELVGVIATLAIGWLLPSISFIVTFHVRSPLSIIFPSNNRQPNVDPTVNAINPSAFRRTHGRTDSLIDPSSDPLLARKERQLQRRRLGRRLWQDLIVYVGILPIGSITIGWTLGHLIGIW